MVGYVTHYGSPPPNLTVLGSKAEDAITLGRLVHRDGTIGRKIRIGKPLHVLVFGPNGKGKGTRILMPNLLQMSGLSIVVVDPKGELAAVTAAYRRRLGKVVILNPFGVNVDIPGYEDLKSDGYNPLLALNPAAPSFNVEASLFAEAIVPIAGKEPHWDESARSMVSAFTMYAALEAQREGREPTMARFREMLCEWSVEPNKDNGFEGIGIPKRALDMMRLGIPGLSNKASQFCDWNREIQSIASTARRHTEPFDDPEIVEDMSKDGFDFAELKRKPTTVYLILPPEMMERHAKWLRLTLTAALQSVLRARRPGEPKVLFMLDEFFALGRLDIISTVWALTRGYGVQIMPVLQDLPQLKKLYPDAWETFIGMAGAVASFGANDPTTAEWMSRRAGDTSADIRTLSMSKSETGSPNWPLSGGSTSTSISSNYSSQRVPLMSQQHLFGLHPGYLMLVINGLQNVAPAYAPAYYEIAQCIDRARPNPYYLG